MYIRTNGRSKAQTALVNWKRLFVLTIIGGAAFWVVDFVIALSPLGSAYKTAFMISSLPVALVEALVGGLVVAFFVSYFLLHFFERIPGNKTIIKSLILCFCAMASIEVLSAIANPSNASVYLVLDTGMNAPRFLALGWMTSYIFDKQTRKVQ